MQQQPQHQLTVHGLTTLAKKAGVDYRTLLRYFAGLTVQPKKRAAIEAALYEAAEAP